jgi:hypothetical protein
MGGGGCCTKNTQSEDKVSEENFVFIFILKKRQQVAPKRQYLPSAVNSTTA